MLGGGAEVDGGKLKREYEAAKEENERLKKQIREVKEEVPNVRCRSRRKRTCDPDTNHSQPLTLYLSIKGLFGREGPEQLSTIKNTCCIDAIRDG